MPPMKTNSNDSLPESCRLLINDVVAKVRQDFLDDGAGEQALQLLLQRWCSKMIDRQASTNLSKLMPYPSKSPKGKVSIPVLSDREPIRDPDSDPENVVVKEDDSLKGDDEIEAKGPLGDLGNHEPALNN